MVEATNTQTENANVEERVREREEGDVVREEGPERGTGPHPETEQGGTEPSDIESSLLPSSQEELRMKRLQHLKQ